MEKLVERHIRDDLLRKYTLHQNQHAYQTGKSTDTAIHNVVTRIENAIEHTGNTKGAFERTSFDIIKQAAEKHGIDPTIFRWICGMLESRNIKATLSGENLGAATVRGSPQGGALSPLLWSLIVEELLWELNYRDYYTVGCADDTVTLINEKFPQTVSEVLQTAQKQSNSGVKGRSCPSTQIRR
jgi:hypothetical protein